MKQPRFWVTSAMLTIGTAAAVVWLAPVTYGQAGATVRQDRDRDVARRIEILSGRGSALGITIRDVEGADATAQKLPASRGAVIDSVDEGGAAARGGLKTGDVVVAFDGETVRSARQFSRLVKETPAGRTVKATVVRQGARVDLDVTPAADRPMRFAGRIPDGLRSGRVPVMPNLPAMPDLSDLDRLSEIGPGNERSIGGQSRLGVSVQSLSPQLAEYFGAQDGVLVSAVRDDSPAARAGVRAGDVIASVNGDAVNDPGDLRRAIRDADGREVAIGIVRDRKPLDLKVPLETREDQPRRPRSPI
jgi:serine protease Do